MRHEAYDTRRVHCQPREVNDCAPDIDLAGFPFLRDEDAVERVAEHGDDEQGQDRQHLREMTQVKTERSAPQSYALQHAAGR